MKCKAAVGDFEETLEQEHRAVVELLRGNAEPQKRMFSHRADVTLANPFGRVMRGWEEVERTLDEVGSRLSAGDVRFENLVTLVTSELAFVVEIEHSIAKIGARSAAPFDLRVTSIFRPEEDGWRIVHRHADPLTEPRPMEWVVE